LWRGNDEEMGSKGMIAESKRVGKFRELRFERKWREESCASMDIMNNIKLRRP